jgi:hypothetical protein
MVDAVSRISRWFRNGDELSILYVDMDFLEYRKILNQREQALILGAYIPDEGDAAEATYRHGDLSGRARVTLTPGLAEYLGNEEKWGFFVHLRDDNQLLELSQFTLMDPERNNGLYQWAFTRALAREGLLAPRYHLVRLVINGSDRGVYALQEAFDAGLPLASDRSSGVIIGYDARALWELAVQFDGNLAAAFRDPVAGMASNEYRYMPIDDRAREVIAEDPALSEQFEEAVRLLRRLQLGERPAAVLFDVERYGLFLAIVNLFGATEATVPPNLKYLYSPTTGLLEPVATNGNPMRENTRLSWAAAYYEPRIQSAYVSAVNRITEPEYLDGLRTALEPEWGRLSAQLTESGRKDQDLWTPLQRRQSELRASMNPAKPVIAFIDPPYVTGDEFLYLNVANIINLPIAVLGIDVGGALFLEAGPEWLQNRETERHALETGSNTSSLSDSPVLVLQPQANDDAALDFQRFDVPIAALDDPDIDFRTRLEINVATQVLGMEEARLTKALPVPLLGGS